MKNVKKNINVGVYLLKFIMSFIIVCCHFYINDSSALGICKVVVNYKGYAVLIFMIISGYYSTSLFLNENINKYSRVLKLFYSQVIWAILYWSIYSILNKSIINPTNLLWQILTGHSEILNPTMWYQFVLIVLLLIGILSGRFLKKNFIVFWVLLSVFTLFFQFSGLNYNIFNNLRYELKYPLGRLFEMIPYFTCGILLYYYNILDYLKKYWVKSLLIFIPLLVFLYNYKFSYVAPGFGYSNLYGLLISLITIIIFYVLPFKENLLSRIIILICKYSVGVYFIHRLINQLLVNFNIGYNYLYSFRYCCLVFLVSNLLCFAIDMIFKLIKNEKISTLIVK